MRKGLIFKKGIIIALAAAVFTSPAPVMGVSDWGVMTAKAEETTTEKIPEYLLMGSTRLIDNGEFQDDEVSGNDDTIYQGTNWYYDITRNQLVLENASISGNITIQNGDLSIMLSGTNTMRSDMVIQSILTESGIVPTLEINGNNQNESLSCGKISADDLGSNNNNIKIIGATLETSQIECSGSLTIENSHVVANEEDHSNVISGDKINIVDSYVEAKATTERYEGEVIRSNQQINVSGSQIVVSRALACQEPVLSDCDFSNSVITKQWNDIDTGDDVTKTYVYGKAALKEDLTIASGESIEFESSASIANLDKLIVKDGATILIDGAEHKHNTNGNITYIWQDDKEHTKGVACKDCPIGYVTKETKSHNYNSQGFCTDCDAYQPAVLTTDKYDINEDGTKDAVYEISNAGQLYWFAGLVNGTLLGVEQNVSANAVLTADIVVNKNVLKSDGTLNEGTFKEWTPITGSSNSTYSGIFDGQNHTISGLYFNQEDSYDVGLFGRNNGKIANAGILDSYFYGTSKVGGVCGNNYTGTISNCYNTGSVSGIGTAGGVSGYNYTGSITNCYNTGNVSGSSGFVGGVSGYNSKGTIINSYNAGSVSGLEYVGGVSGINYTGSITDCYNIGSVSGSEGNVGGVNGYNDGGTITNSYNAGSVSGTERYVGGVSGYNDGGTITNCYNVGSVGGSGYVGGVNGWNKGIITNCYNTGSVSGTGVNVGGVIGRNESNATITNCYYDSTIYTGNAIGANDGTTEKVEGKTTKQFKTGEVTYLLQNGQSEGIWGQTIGTDTYPVLHGPKVYESITYMGCNDSSAVASVSYSNEKKDVFGKHNFEDGICKYCGEKLAATVTKGDETLSCVSLPEAIGYAENMPGSVVTVMEDTNTTLDINNPDSDFTIDINGHKIDDINVNNGKITIIASKTGGYVKGELDIKKDSTVTIGDVKISGTIYTTGQLILNGGDIYRIILADKTIKLYFNNSDIKINEGIYLYGAYGEEIIINAEPHNVIPIVLDGISVQQGAAYAVAGAGIALKSDWFNVSSNDFIIDLSTSIEDNKLRIGALLNDKVYVELDENKNITYSGSELKPSVNVYYNRNYMSSVQLKEGSDYNVTYSDNINTGTATAIVTGIGAYSGTKKVTFTIEPKKISSPIFDGLKPEYTYTGQKVEPEFALMDGDTVIPSSEYEVSYSDNTEVGTAAITITDVMGGNYDINCKAEFDIVKADPVISELPVADPISYDPHKTLNEASISGGVVIGVSGENITGTWSWADDSVVPSVDVTDYDVIFIPDDQKHYNSVRGTIQLNVSKADVEVVELPAASGITYGDNLAKAVISGGRVSFDGIDQVEIPGTFAWKDDSIKPFVSDSDNTLYTVVFTPADSVNYNTAEIEITVNVSKAAMPNLLLSVDNTHKTVGSIALPGDWTWLDADAKTAIKAGGSVEATAVYVGDDKENYDSTELKITIYRAACSEGKTVKYTLKGEKAPTCTKSGTGHTECSICGDVMSTGVYVKELGHKWNSGRVTRKPTYTATGVKTFTCTVCKATKIGSIAKLATTDISKKTSKITVSGIENKIYNGKVHTQKSLVVKAGAKTLRLNKDYTVTYSKNKAVGKASVTICGKNAYSGKITKTFTIVKAAKGKTYTVGKFRYTITGAKADGTGTVAIAGTTYSRSDKKFASLTIADTVVIGDVRFKITSVSANAFSRYTALKNVTIGNNVTSIGANAFLSCKNLKKMTIKSAKLRSVGAKAFSGTYSKITFAVPGNKATAYKKLIKKGSPSAKAIYK
ncbi:GLUG motif-containing protein [Coprococcus eutactus]|uniref:GLUG motif-containing protein n=1 Tax=Coprococcus eutactus TaxID=33043 RepID=UPI00156EB8CB|nr:GLUG motif-containing protein [Coprococcus eutactus]NSE71741.1 leucine-rich repeat protein [Coprococcus eutactus]